MAPWRLGRHCDALYARCAELHVEVDPLWAAYHARIAPFIDASRRGEPVDLMHHVGEIQKELGIDGDSPLDAITDALDAPMRRIMELPAHGAAGIAVKAAAAAFACSHFWDEEFADADWPEKAVRSLVEAVLAAADQSLPFPVEA